MNVYNTRYPVVGMKFLESAYKIINTLQDGAIVKLVREPINQYDANAVAVYVDGAQIGYIAKEKSAVLAEFIDQAGEPFAILAQDAVREEKSITAKFVRSPYSGLPQVEVSG